MKQRLPCDRPFFAPPHRRSSFTQPRRHPLSTYGRSCSRCPGLWWGRWYSSFGTLHYNAKCLLVVKEIVERPRKRELNRGRPSEWLMWWIRSKACMVDKLPRWGVRLPTSHFPGFAKLDAPRSFFFFFSVRLLVAFKLLNFFNFFGSMLAFVYQCL